MCSTGCRPARAHAGGHAHPPADGGASVRDHQGLDGQYALFLMRTLEKVRTEMSLHVLAYNLKRMISIVGVGPLLRALAT